MAPRAQERELTILFKKSKTTVILSLLPQDSISWAKSQLLQALKSREINPDAFPDDYENIQFGIPVDPANLSEGWKPLQLDHPPQEDLSKKARNVDTLTTCQLKDGAKVAFRFLSPGEDEPEWDVVIPDFEYEDEDEENEEQLDS